MKKTNYVFYMNLPLLIKKRSYGSTTIIKNVLYDDIYRELENKEVERLLTDTFAEEELIKILEKRYGKVKDLFNINYQINDIISILSK